MTKQEFIDHAAVVIYVQIVGNKIPDGSLASGTDAFLTKASSAAYMAAESLWKARQKSIDDVVKATPEIGEWRPNPKGTPNDFVLDLGGGFFANVYQYDEPRESFHQKWAGGVYHDEHMLDWFLSDLVENPGPYPTREEAEVRALYLALEKLGPVIPAVLALKTRLK